MSEESLDPNVPNNAKDLAFMYLGTASKKELQYLEYLLTQFTKSKDQQIKELTDVLNEAVSLINSGKWDFSLESAMSYQSFHKKIASYQQKYPTK